LGGRVALFWGAIGCVANPQIRQRRVFFRQFDQGEIGQLDLSPFAAGQQHIGWFDVAMHHAAPMDCCGCRGNLFHQSDGAGQGQATWLIFGGDVIAGFVFSHFKGQVGCLIGHDKEWVPIHAVQGFHGNDLGMVKSG
jgi:hypothetical protein